MEAFAAPGAERHYVGKRGLQKSFKQTQIDALLVDLCKQVATQHISCMLYSTCLELQSGKPACNAKEQSSCDNHIDYTSPCTSWASCRLAAALRSTPACCAAGQEGGPAEGRLPVHLFTGVWGNGGSDCRRHPLPAGARRVVCAGGAAACRSIKTRCCQLAVAVLGTTRGPKNGSKNSCNS